MLNTIIDFLGDLSRNNNREWFNENRERYEVARQEMFLLTSDMIVRLAAVEPALAYLEPKNCLFRIYRDIRFSPDKSPYKRHFGTYIASPNGSRSPWAGYYIHIEPGGCMLASGLWEPDVKRLRSIIDTDYDELACIIHNPDFRRFFPDGLSSPYDKPLKRVPRPYPVDHPAAEWLKLRQLCIAWPFPDAMLKQPDFEDRIEEVCRQMAPFARWCNQVYFDE